LGEEEKKVALNKKVKPLCHLPEKWEMWCDWA
jgi:hypothetical protein